MPAPHPRDARERVQPGLWPGSFFCGDGAFAPGHETCKINPFRGCPHCLKEIFMTDMTAAEFAAELKKHGFRVVGVQITSDDCPGVAWNPVKRMGRLDRARTLRKVIQKRSEEMARQVRASVVVPDGSA
jgi:hypothetical protein